MSKPWDVISFGSCMIDLVSYAPRLPKPGETLRGTKFNIAYGGKGANQGFSSKILGADTLLIGRLGDDAFGKDYLKVVQSYGIPTDFIRITENCSSGVAQICVAENGENHIVIVPGANDTVTKDDLKEPLEAIKNCKVLICQLEITLETTLEALRIKKDSGIGISIFNGAPAQTNIDPQFYTLPNIFCVNETEAEFITGLRVSSMEEAVACIKEFHKRGCREVILTLGANGALYSGKDYPELLHVPAPKVKPVDTTGAGDAFIGAIAFTYAKFPDMPIADRLKFACKVAAISVTREGTQKSFATYDEQASFKF